MEITQAFFDSISSLGMLLSKDSPDPTQCILSGIQSKDEYYRVRQTFPVFVTSRQFFPVASGVPRARSYCQEWTIKSSNRNIH